MQLLIEQRLFTIGAKYDVTDIGGQPVYTVESEIFTIGRQMHVYDMHGNEVAVVSQRAFSIPPRFEVYRCGRLTDTITKRMFVFFSMKFEISSETGENWEVEGDFMSHEFTVTSGGQPVAAVHKEWFTFGDRYQIDIADRPNVDPIRALAVVLAVDTMIDASRDN